MIRWTAPVLSTLLLVHASEDCTADPAVCAAMKEEADEGTMLLSLRASRVKHDSEWHPKEWKCCFTDCDHCNPPLEAHEFSTYPGYTGKLKVSGVVTVGEKFHHDGQVVTYELHGLDKECTSHNNTGLPPNACGIHIHAGTTCKDAGGHAFDKHKVEQDPWLPIAYHAHHDGKAWNSRGFHIKTGFSLSDVGDKVVVVHDATGARVACSPMVPFAPLMAKQFYKYAGYRGAMHVYGSVKVTGDATGQHLTWKLHHADPRCKHHDNSKGPKNSCGIHIHKGLTCDKAGGHLYNHTLAHDPWLKASYKADDRGKTYETKGVKVHTKLDTLDIAGSVVIHDFTGKRISCSKMDRSYELGKDICYKAGGRFRECTVR